MCRVKNITKSSRAITVAQHLILQVNECKQKRCLSKTDRDVINNDIKSFGLSQKMHRNKYKKEINPKPLCVQHITQCYLKEIQEWMHHR